MGQAYAMADLRQPWCGLGISGLRTGTRYGAGWIVLFTLCLLGGIVTLAKAVGFILDVLLRPANRARLVS